MSLQNDFMFCNQMIYNERERKREKKREKRERDRERKRNRERREYVMSCSCKS